MRPRIIHRLRHLATTCSAGVRLAAHIAVLTAAASAATAPVARAQETEVAGTVTAVGTGEPLPGAQIVVVGGTQRAVSDERGRFRITGLTGQNIVLEVRRIGYRLERVAARAGTTNLGIALMVNPASLEAVVVTGTVGATERRAVGNAVTTINAAEVAEIAPVQNMQQLLNGRAPGVVIQQATGAIGGGSRIRVRGATSLSLNNEPLLYIDGVRVNNQTGVGPANQAFGSSSISRINDINPEDIETIEVLKGPAAATLYGTQASSGVINIITKKGATGAARWNTTFKQGVNYLRNWRGIFDTNHGRNPNTNQIEAINQDSLVAANGGDLFRNGPHQEAELSVSGGTDRVSYYASGGYLDSQGAEPSNFRRQYTGRVNLAVSPATQLKVSTNVGFITGPTYLSPEAGFGGRVFTTVLATPTTYNSRFNHGFHSAIPYQYDMMYRMWQDVDRFTAGVRIDHQPINWFQHRFTAGADRTREGNNSFRPRIDSLVAHPSFQAEALGFRSVNTRTVTYRTFDYSATGTFGLGSDFRPTLGDGAPLRFATSVGSQFYHELTDSVYSQGSVFPAPGLSSVNATTVNRANGGDFVEDKAFGLYVQEQVSWRDRLFVTAALRSDDHSAFGANFNRIIYPKYSLSWVASQENWWPLDAVNSFRIRAAYGEAGRAPATFDALPTLSPTTGPGDQPALLPLSVGNPNLGPEVGKEIEVGFDAGALGERVNLEVTYYNKKTTDAILFREVAPSGGVPGVQPFNAGSIRNNGWEVLLRGTPYRGNVASIDLSLSYANNDNEVLDLGTPGLAFVTAGTALRHAVGYPVGSWFEQRVVSAQINQTTGQAIVSQVLCDNGQGGTMICAGPDLVYGNADDAPDVFLGRTVPKHEGSVSGTLTLWNRLRVYGLVDWKTGWKKIDGNTRARCLFFGGRCRENFFPLEGDPVRVAQIQSNANLIDFFISDAGFTKFREVSVSYLIPERFSRRARASRASLSVSGRNLATWTNYTGLEPEAFFLSGSRGGQHSIWEQTTLPQLSQWLVTLSLGF